MENQVLLHHLLNGSASDDPDSLAVEEAQGGAITYRELARLSDQLRDRLIHLGVSPGDRVGICMRKSIDSVISIFGILKTGAAYVPVDPGAPASRIAFILSDCSVKVVVVETVLRDSLVAESAWDPETIEIIIDEPGGGHAILKALEHAQNMDPAPIVKTVDPSTDSLAYILYTSGSTGKPKGVMHSHEHAVTYIEWCTEVFQPSRLDCFSSHAPFHFDLSILDIFTSIRHGAKLVLIDEELGKDPQRLAQVIHGSRITIWYSTPSVLSLLVQYGKLEKYKDLSIRILLFAGEIFPVKYLRTLKSIFPNAKHFNLYGPTETNVCTYYEIPQQIPEDRVKPYPIGKSCSHVKTRVIDESHQEVKRGEEGEICVNGPAVMQGYWKLSEQTQAAFFMDSNGIQWYKTGDIVYEDPYGDYVFIGRRDRMVKKRGYRVELGEIEVALYSHPQIEEAAVIAVSDLDDGVKVKAFICSSGKDRISIIALKRFCVENLPQYMIPDFFSFQPFLPKTSTDKIDYQKLEEMD